MRGVLPPRYPSSLSTVALCPVVSIPTYLMLFPPSERYTVTNSTTCSPTEDCIAMVLYVCRGSCWGYLYSCTVPPSKHPATSSKQALGRYKYSNVLADCYRYHNVCLRGRGGGGGRIHGLRFRDARDVRNTKELPKRYKGREKHSFPRCRAPRNSPQWVYVVTAR